MTSFSVGQATDVSWSELPAIILIMECMRRRPSNPGSGQKALALQPIRTFCPDPKLAFQAANLSTRRWNIAFLPSKEGPRQLGAQAWRIRFSNLCHEGAGRVFPLELDVRFARELAATMRPAETIADGVEVDVRVHDLGALPPRRANGAEIQLQGVDSSLAKAVLRPARTPDL